MRTPQDVVGALLEAAELKALARAGWVQRGLEGPGSGVESVAAHSWGVAWLVVALLPAELDRGRALAYAVLHDLPEVYVGDLTPADNVAPVDKREREREALARLTAGLPSGARIQALWAAYEAQIDPEARFVKQLDRLDMAVQAVVYATGAGLDPSEFMDSAAQHITHPDLTPLLAVLRRRALHAAGAP